MEQVIFIFVAIFVIGVLVFLSKNFRIDSSHDDSTTILSLYGIDYKPEDIYVQKRKDSIEYLGDKYLLAKSMGRLKKENRDGDAS